MHRIQRLKCREIPPGPGAFHAFRIIKEITRKRQVKAVGAEAVIRQRMDSCPEVPDRDLIFIRELSNRGVDGMVPFR